MSERLNLKNVTALVADGDTFGAGLLVQMLHGLGLDNVKLAARGAEARKEIEKQDYELFLCDADLPDAPAIEIVHWLRRLPGQKRFLPTLVLTGYSDFG